MQLAGLVLPVESEVFDLNVAPLIIAANALREEQPELNNQSADV